MAIPMIVLGQLPRENRVSLGIVEKTKEYFELRAEYRTVYGYDIKFTLQTVDPKEYAEAKTKAWKYVFSSLNGPITNVLTNITQTKK